MPAVLGYGAGLAVVLGVFDYTGGSLTGWVLGPPEDIVARKALLRSTFRLPMDETIGEIGEGRGMRLFSFFFLLPSSPGTEVNGESDRHLPGGIRRPQTREADEEVRHRFHKRREEMRRERKQKTNTHSLYRAPGGDPFVVQNSILLFFSFLFSFLFFFKCLLRVSKEGGGEKSQPLCSFNHEFALDLPNGHHEVEGSPPLQLAAAGRREKTLQHGPCTGSRHL